MYDTIRNAIPEILIIACRKKKTILLEMIEEFDDIREIKFHS